jgi:competence protein ComEA
VKRNWCDLWRLLAVVCWTAVGVTTAPAMDINSASEADMDSLRGVGPATTRRILAEREVAAFASWHDLMTRVKGVRSAAARRWSDQGVTVGGQPFSSGPQSTTDQPTAPARTP